MNQDEANTIYEMLRTWAVMGVLAEDTSEVDAEDLIIHLKEVAPKLGDMIGLPAPKPGGES